MNRAQQNLRSRLIKRIPAQEVLSSPGSRAALFPNPLGVRPVPFRPALSSGLPFPGFRQSLESKMHAAPRSLVSIYNPEVISVTAGFLGPFLQIFVIHV